jgi:uncharacterized protein (TIGR03086 family)
VRNLADHVIGGGQRYVMLLRGAEAAALAATRDQDHVGSDPVGSFWRWQAPLADEFGTSGALTRVVHHRAGDRSGQDLLGMRILELTLHAWDLARSLGRDERLDASLARHVLDRHLHLVDGLRERGLYAPPRAAAGPDAQEQLLARTGRA